MINLKLKAGDINFIVGYSYNPRLKIHHITLTNKKKLDKSEIKYILDCLYNNKRLLKEEYINYKLIEGDIL